MLYPTELLALSLQTTYEIDTYVNSFSCKNPLKYLKIVHMSIEKLTWIETQYQLLSRIDWLIAAWIKTRKRRACFKHWRWDLQMHVARH